LWDIILLGFVCEQWKQLLHSRDKNGKSIFKKITYIDHVCATYSLSMARWIFNVFSVDRWFILFNRWSILRHTCVNGNIEVAEWLMSTFDITITRKENFHSKHTLFAAMCCRKNGIKIITWFINKFDLRSLKIKKDKHCAFYNACVSGHLDTARWLMNNFKIKPEKIKSLYNVSFLDRDRSLILMCCKNNHTEIVKWLVEIFDYSVDDINMHMIDWIRQNMQSEIAQWILSRRLE